MWGQASRRGGKKDAEEELREAAELKAKIGGEWRLIFTTGKAWDKTKKQLALVETLEMRSVSRWRGVTGPWHYRLDGCRG